MSGKPLETRIKRLEDILDRLQKKLANQAGEAELGRRFKDYLKAEIGRVAALIGEAETISFSLEGIDEVPKLLEMKLQVERLWDKRCPPRGHAALGFSSEPQLAVSKFAEADCRAFFSQLGLSDEQTEKAVEHLKAEG